MKQRGMSRVCSTHRKDEKCIQYFGRRNEGKSTHLGNL